MSIKNSIDKVKRRIEELSNEFRETKESLMDTWLSIRPDIKPIHNLLERRRKRIQTRRKHKKI